MLELTLRTTVNRLIMLRLMLIFCMTITLGSCMIFDEPEKITNKNPKESTNTKVLPPKYLSIKGFKNCLDTRTVSNAQFYCMPSEQPNSCTDQAWEKLNNLKGTDKIPSCS